MSNASNLFSSSDSSSNTAVNINSTSKCVCKDATNDYAINKGKW